MCSRITLASERERILRELGLRQLDIGYQPSYNVAPTQPVLAVASENGETYSTELRWGLVPFWADDPSIGSRLINARAETLPDKPAFRASFKNRRCLIVADGFYEWRHEGKQKLPYYIHFQDGRPFTFAGLWDCWDKGGAPLRTCTIVTTEASPFIAPLHDRMPVIVPPGDRDLWLDPDAGPHALQSLLHPYEGGDLETYRVSTRMNRSSYDAPDCIEPVAPDEGSPGPPARPGLSLFPDE